MRTRNRIDVVLTLCLIVVLVTPLMAVAQYEGSVFTGKYLRVGINNYGALGIDDSELGLVGFQYPIGFDSITPGWVGDGWAVFYGERALGFSADDELWGNESNIVPTIKTQTLKDGYLRTITMNTDDSQLQLTFKFRTYTDKKFLVVIAFIKNTGESTITDLEFKKNVDWDVLSFDWETDYWGEDSIRKPAFNLAVAFQNATNMGGDMLPESLLGIMANGFPSQVYLGFASFEKPTGYDLDWGQEEWDYYYRGMPAYPEQPLISAAGTTSWQGDGAAVYDWYLSTLNPGQTKAIHMVYAAGDTLQELETQTAMGWKLSLTIK